SGGVAVSDATSVNDSQEIPFAPDLKYSIAGQYDIPMDGGRRIQINGSYVYTDEQLSGNIGQTGGVFLLPDYAILNASVGYFTEDDKLGITLIGKNLTDESYATTFSGDGFRYQIPRNADRYFGIDFVLNFN
ncbi:MAG: TonB-dependent receptor, partial [Pseudomonadota bacterium]